MDSRWKKERPVRQVAMYALFFAALVFFCALIFCTVHHHQIRSCSAGAIVILSALLVLVGWDNWRRRTFMRQAEDRESQLQKLMDLVPGGICSFKVDEEDHLEMLHFNAGFYQFLGFTAPATGVVELDPFTLIHPDDLETFSRQIRLCHHNSRRLHATFRLQRQDGSYTWVSLQAAVAGEENGKYTYCGVLSDVDEFKKMQEHLEEDEHTLQTAMEHAEIDYWIYEPQGHCIIMSRQFASVHGLPRTLENYPESWLQLNITQEEDIPKLLAALKKIDDGAKSASCEVREHRADGSIRWILLEMTTLYHTQGIGARVLCTSRDHTERHREIERYERQSEQIRSALPNAVASCHLNLTQDICVVGSSRYLGLFAGMDGTVDSLIQRMKSRSVNPEQAEIFEARFHRRALLEAYERGTSQMSFDRCCWINGGSRWLSVKVEITRNPVTNDVEANMYSFDIDVQKSMEQIMQTVIPKEYIMILRFDLRTDTARVFFSAESQNSMHEITHAEKYFLKEFQERYAGNDLEGTLQQLRFSEIRKKLEKNGEFILYTDCKDDEGRIRRVRYAFALLDRQSDSICCTVSDVTETFIKERRRSEILQTALENARRANEAKSDFLSRMSHEIRTPMNAILGLTQMMMQDTHDVEMQANLERIQTSGEYLLGLINDVLDMSRIESGRIELHPENTNAYDIFKTVQDMVVPRMEEKQIRFCMNTSGVVIPYVIIDRLRIQQVYINILSNAIKFSEPGTEISCIVTHEPCQFDQIACTIVFRDQGCGMSPEFQQRVFMPFEQESNSYQNPQMGTGLGLAIVKNLVEQMGGTITVKSQLGLGSEFTVRIVAPKGHPVEDRQNRMIEAAGQTSLEGRRVLLVEDHPVNTEIAKRILSRQGMIVDHAENGRKAVEKYLVAKSGFYDLILMDIRMPVMDGIEATKQIRASKNPDAQTIPIIAMTANAFESDQRQTLEAGMNAHISKPVRLEVLLDILRKHLK